jgi:hypothetical protein
MERAFIVLRLVRHCRNTDVLSSIGGVIDVFVCPGDGAIVLLSIKHTLLSPGTSNPTAEFFEPIIHKCQFCALSKRAGLCILAGS